MRNQSGLMGGTFPAVYVKCRGIRGLIQTVHLPSPAFGSFFHEK